MITYFSLSSTSSWLVSENGKNKQNINSAVSHIFSACLIILHDIAGCKRGNKMHGYWVFNGVVTYVSNWLGYVKGKVQQKIMRKKIKKMRL